jgi:SAM-dependent methyltransferase
MFKSVISGILRKTHLLHLSDVIRFLYQKSTNNASNRAFRKENPGIVLPPDYLIYESFQLDYKKYYTDSQETAQWLKGLFNKHISLYNVNILDWGCGPARIIRHLPTVIGNACFYYGTDYNPRTIQWCRDHIKGVNFSQNRLSPRLEFNNGFFHIIYGISIFTHLSEPMHIAWMKELNRILSHGGILMLTTQGEAFRTKLTKKELEQFDNNQLVVRGQVKEGHRIYSAFQPEKYMKKLFGSLEIVEFIKGENTGPRPQQDIWIVKKKPGNGR